jgi:hypothetical protein
MRSTYLDRIRALLADQSGAWYAIEAACKAALDAGHETMRYDPRDRRSEKERFAVALQAAIEVMQRIGLELTEESR